MNIIRKYANISIKILGQYLPIIPIIKLTNAKKYCGRCHTITIDEKIVQATIKISKFNHINHLWLMDVADHIEIIDTICHELAHLHIMEHGKGHAQITEIFKEEVLKHF